MRNFLLGPSKFGEALVHMMDIEEVTEAEGHGCIGGVDRIECDQSLVHIFLCENSLIPRRLFVLEYIVLEVADKPI